MKNSSTFLMNALKGADSLKASPRVIAEWNQNRYASVKTVDNWNYPEATNAYNTALYPITSIVEPLRPHAGLLKARTYEGAVTTGYQNYVRQVQVYTASENAKYKYWTSPTQSDAAPTAGVYPISNVAPYVIYNASIWVNKVLIGFETTNAAPADFVVEITTDGTTWSTIATNPGIDSLGRVSLWLQSDGVTWAGTEYYTQAIQILGVRVTVTSLNAGSSWLDLIELSPRLENDLTDYLVDYSFDYTISSESQIAPLGVASSNTGSVTLSNYDGRFTNENTSSLYAGMIDANVKFTVDLGIDTSSWGGTGLEYIRLSTMFSENWGSDIEKVVVPLKDGSKFLQEVSPNDILMTDVSFGSAIWQMCDSVGFNDYAYDADANTPAHALDFFWTDKTITIWDNIQKLCESTQNAAYFDEYGVLRIATRDYIFSGSKPVSWTTNYGPIGTDVKPDIINLAVSGQFEANKVTIHYKPTRLAIDAQGNPIQEVVWKPDGDVTLRASSLLSDMTDTQMFIYMTAKDAVVWPYSGLMTVGGEIVRYNGKEYTYIDVNNVKQTVILTDDDTRQNIDKNLSNPNTAWTNSFTGKFILTERGVGRSIAQTHSSSVNNGWGTAYRGGGGSVSALKVGFQQIKDQNLFRIFGMGTTAYQSWFYRHTESGISYIPEKYGTRLRFPSSPAGSERTAGIFFFGDSSRQSMYQVEIQSTESLSKYDRRKTSNEIRLIKYNHGTLTRFCGSGAVQAVADDLWYDVDVQVDGNVITVSVNGKLALSIADASPLPATPNCGLFVRGNTIADFEYWYDADASAIPDPDPDESGFLDLINGGYFSPMFYKTALYGTTHYTTSWRGITHAVKGGFANRTFEEFGAVIHEVREFDVTFDKGPVMYSSPYMSNDYQAAFDEYVGTPFGATFVVANTYRYNAVINGDDALTFGADNVVSQQFMVSGRLVQQAEEKTYVSTNDVAIRARGEITIDITSDWIQTDDAAKALGDWITQHWAGPNDELSIDIYGNPLIQIGDVVAVNYSPLQMTADNNKYFVLGTSNGWSDGPTTTLKLRRIRF